MSYSNLALDLSRTGRIKEAERALAAAIKLDPGYATAHNNLGDLYRKQKRYREAEVELRRAVELEPLAPLYVANLGALYSDTGRGHLEESLCRAYLLLMPDTAMILNNLAFNLSERNIRLDEALAFQHRAVKLTPNHPSRVHTLARILFQLRQLAEAERTIRRAIELYGSSPDAEANGDLGLILEAKGDKLGAIDELRKSLAIDPNQEKFKKALARLLGGRVLLSSNSLTPAAHGNLVESISTS